MEDIKWREAPGFPQYQISNTGLLRRVRTQKNISQHECKTSKGFYYHVNITNASGVRKLVTIHRLVCEAFHGPPPKGKPYVNHDDGDKTNNHETNVYWSSHGDNVKHAYANGLNDHVIKLRVSDLETGDIVDYNSISEFEDAFGVKKGYGYSQMNKRVDGVLYGRYRVELLGSYNVPNFKRNRPLKAVDFKTNTHLVSRNISEMAFNTGVTPTTITSALKSNNQPRLINGIFFWEGDTTAANEILKLVTPDMIETSLKRYESKNKRRDESIRNSGVWARCCKSKEITYYKSLVRLRESLGIGAEELRKYLDKEPNYPMRGCELKLHGDDRPWKFFPVHLVEASTKGPFGKGRIIKVDHKPTNTTEYYPRIGLFAKAYKKSTSWAEYILYNGKQSNDIVASYV